MTDLSSIIFNLFSSPTSIFVLTLLAALYFFVGKANHDYFAKRGIPFVKPKPFFGTIFRPALGLEDFYTYYNRVWRQFDRVPFFGAFDFFKPVYIIKDADLAKQILIKDFDHFVNHRVSVDHEIDPVFGRNLFAIKDQRWRDMRNILSPAFTGSKMRFLFKVINTCAVQSVEQIQEITARGSYDFEVKECFTRVTNDVIATAAFGVEVNSTKNVNNDFYLQGRRLTNIGIRETVKFFLYSTVPKIMNKTGLRLFDKSKTEFLENIVQEAINYREKTGFVRPDMIHLLLEAKNKGHIEDDEHPREKVAANTIEWTNEDIIAQCLLFFVAGFETASTLYVFLAYELALNPDIQDRLRAEVDAMTQKLEGQFPGYEEIMSLKYLDMVVSEALRKWPPNLVLDRLVSKDYIMSAQGQSVALKRGEMVIIPTIAFHHDASYFPEPETFNPERFSDENKANIHPAAYTPFGIGPRQCIGNRLALMEVKIFFYHLLANYSIEKNAKTQIPPQIIKGTLIVTPINGLWLTFKPRA